MHRTTPRKPEAPVEADPKEKGKPRTWTWVGESIASKGLLHDYQYDAEFIRKAGFKLPKIGGGKKSGKSKDVDGL